MSIITFKHTPVAPLIGRFSGYFLQDGPGTVRSTQPYLFVEFSTDQSSIGDGFSFDYRPVCQRVKPCKEMTKVLPISSTLTIGISEYQNNLNCSWLFTSDSSAAIFPNRTKPCTDPRVELNFLSLSTEKDYDYIQLFDGDSTSGPRNCAYSDSPLDVRRRCSFSPTGKQKFTSGYSYRVFHFYDSPFFGNLFWHAALG